MSIDAMKQALEALEEMKAEFRALDLPYGSKAYAKANNSTHALRAAIEQAQEPVAWQVMVEDEAMKEFPIKDMAHDWCAKEKLSGSPSAYWIRPLYTAPRQWQRLTSSEITAIELSLRQYHDGDRYDLSLADFASAIEAKLKEKNT